MLSNTSINKARKLLRHKHFTRFITHFSGTNPFFFHTNITGKLAYSGHSHSNLHTDLLVLTCHIQVTCLNKNQYNQIRYEIFTAFKTKKGTSAHK